jgi:hypothetical protein
MKVERHQQIRISIHLPQTLILSLAQIENIFIACKNLTQKTMSQSGVMGMAFFKQGYGRILLIGLGLVLLAAAIWIIQVEPAESATIPQRVLVQEAVNDLSPCLTCHSSTASEVQLAAYRAPKLHGDNILAADNHTIPVVSDLRAQVDGQLVETGQRILDLPETSAPDYHTVLSDYLKIYESSRANTDQQVLLNALDRLTRLEQLLNVLEHQASPYKWDAGIASQTVKMVTAALSTVPPPTYAALYHRMLFVELAPAASRYWEDLAILAPERVVSAAYRRGPPASDMLFESV